MSTSCGSRQIRDEALIDLHAQRGNQAVRLIGQADNGQQLGILRIRHALGLRRCAVRGDAILAAIAGAYRQVQQFLGQGIQGPTGRHDFLDVAPQATQGHRIVGQHFPEIVDPVRAPGPHDVVVDRPHVRRCRVVFDGTACDAHDAIAVICGAKPDPVSAFAGISSRRA